MKNIDPAVSEAARMLQKLGGDKGGKASWANRTEEEKKEHIKRMHKAKAEKLTPEKRKAIGQKMVKGRITWWSNLSEEERQKHRERMTAIIKKAAQNRWKNVSPEDRRKHALMMLSKKKKVTNN